MISKKGINFIMNQRSCINLGKNNELIVRQMSNSILIIHPNAITYYLLALFHSFLIQSNLVISFRKRHANINIT